MYVVTVNFTIKLEHLSAFKTAMASQAQTSLKEEPDCHQFDVSYDPKRPSECFLYELYTGRERFDIHLETPHFLHFNRLVTPCIEAKSVSSYHRQWPEG